MKIRITLVAIALLGLVAGIAFAGPLVLSELDVRPWRHTVEGPKAEFEVETIFANFTVLDPTDSSSRVDELSVKYQLWVNVTNPSNVSATLLHTFFTAAGEITPFSGPPVLGGNSSCGTGGTAEGVFVDDKWYNLTWVNGTYPYFDSEGNMCESPFPVTEETGYWMEGVQLFRRYTNGSLSAIYLNMNGTWTDVTGRVEVDEPKGGGQYVDDLVVEQRKFFQYYKYMPDVSVEPHTEVTVDGVNVTIGYDDPSVYVPTGDGYFDNYFEAGESRILLIEGVQKFNYIWGDNRAIEILDSGNMELSVSVANSAKRDFAIENNTMQDTWSNITELKTVELTKVNNSYLYNIGLLDEHSFTVDEWNAEVFLDLGE